MHILDLSPTYELLCKTPGGLPVAIRCKGCGLTSHNLNDVLQRYCGFCHVFHLDIPVPQRMDWAAERQRDRRVIDLKERRQNA